MGRKSFINHWNPGLFRELDRGGFDLVIVPGYALLSSQMAIAWAWLRRKPYVVFSESHLREPRSWSRRIVKELLVRLAVSRAAACLATGTLSKEYLCHYGARPERVFFFPNTPDVDWFIRRSDELRPMREKLRQKWGITGWAYGHLRRPAYSREGRGRPCKGLCRGQATVAVRATADRRRWPRGESLRRLVSTHKIEDNVHFLGFHQGNDLVELYVCADLFCLPSRHEPWGVVVNEAAACALPLLLSDRVGAGRDLVRAGQNGYVFASNRPEALERASASILSEAGAWQRMGECSRELVRPWGYAGALQGFRMATNCVIRFMPRRGIAHNRD